MVPAITTTGKHTPISNNNNKVTTKSHYEFRNNKVMKRNVKEEAEKVCNKNKLNNNEKQCVKRTFFLILMNKRTL